MKMISQLSNLNPFKLVEFLLLALLILVALIRPGIGAEWARRLKSCVRPLTSRPWRSILAAAAVGFLTSVSFSVLRMPVPAGHDEFCHLLIADTLLQGQVTNPTHPFWTHFETIHVIHQPTYTSKFPPGHGMLLAVGKLLGGHSVVGLWLGMGLLGGAICWMLQVFVPPRWALLGALVAALRFGSSYWSMTYYGMSLAAVAGALVLGACGRICYRRSLKRTPAVLLGVGLMLLAVSRPYEGLVVSLPIAGFLLVWIVSHQGPGLRLAVTRIVLPCGAVLAVGGGLMAYYNWCVTGHALRMPYQEYTERYASPPVFLWQQPSPTPTYNHSSIKDWHARIELPYFLQQQSWPGFLRESVQKCLIYADFFFGPAFILLLFVLPWTLPARGTPLVLVTLMVFMLGLLSLTYALAHYASPAACLFVLLIVQALRRLSLFGWPAPMTGAALTRALLVTGLASTCLTGVQRASGIGFNEPWARERAEMDTLLKQTEGRHLVFVRYGVKHYPGQEWIYNEPNIDRAKVIWAHEMDAEQNRRLCDYFKDRRLWLLEADFSPPHLQPYPARSEQTSPEEYSPHDLRSGTVSRREQPP